MLNLNLSEGEYILIGDNIKVYFNQRLSLDSVAVAVDAPEDMLIMRRKPYIEGVALLAACGDDNARLLSEKLEAEEAERQLKTTVRRVNHRRHKTPPLSLRA